MTILISSQDRLFITQLTEYVQNFLSLTKVIDNYVILTGLDRVSNVDIVFIDAPANGFELKTFIDTLRSENPRVCIFIIASDTAMLDDSMRLNVFRYMVKPVDRNKLYSNLNDACCYYLSAAQLHTFAGINGIYTISANDIMCIESSQRRTLIHTICEDIACHQNLEYWVSVLRYPQFIQSHRSYIVNMTYIYHIGSDIIELRHGPKSCKAYLSRRKSPVIKKAYLFYISNNLHVN